MPRVTKEQIECAKEWDLLSYLQVYEPQELRRDIFAIVFVTFLPFF